MKPLLILACGNPLRGDDGAGWLIAAALEERFPSSEEIEVTACKQLTPEMAERLSRAESVLFVDASASAQPGCVALEPVTAAYVTAGALSHHLSPATLLGLAHLLYGRAPRRAFTLVIGGQSFSLGEGLSDAVQRALPKALRRIEIFLARRVDLPTSTA